MTDVNVAGSKQQKQPSKCAEQFSALLPAVSKKDVDNDLIENLFREIKTSKKKRQLSMDQINSSEQQSRKKAVIKSSQTVSNGEQSKSSGTAAAGESYGLIKSEYGDNFIVSPEAPLERIDTESGLPVYKAHLLRVGEGGGTSLCPFDCDCCF